MWGWRIIGACHIVGSIDIRYPGRIGEHRTIYMRNFGLGLDTPVQSEKPLTPWRSKKIIFTPPAPVSKCWPLSEKLLCSPLSFRLSHQLQIRPIRSSVTSIESQTY